MKQAIEAVYENGHFRPLQSNPAHLAEGQRVRITVDDECVPESLQLLAAVYDGLPSDHVDEIEQIALDRGAFFGDRSRE